MGDETYAISYKDVLLLYAFASETTRVSYHIFYMRTNLHATSLTGWAEKTKSDMSHSLLHIQYSLHTTTTIAKHFDSTDSILSIRSWNVSRGLQWYLHPYHIRIIYLFYYPLICHTFYMFDYRIMPFLIFKSIISFIIKKSVCE